MQYALTGRCCQAMQKHNSKVFTNYCWERQTCCVRLDIARGVQFARLSLLFRQSESFKKSPQSSAGAVGLATGLAVTRGFLLPEAELLVRTGRTATFFGAAVCTAGLERSPHPSKSANGSPLELLPAETTDFLADFGFALALLPLERLLESELLLLRKSRSNSVSSRTLI